VKTKICSKCKIEKFTDEFTKHPKTKDGLQCRCKSCRKIDKQEYYKLNKDKIAKKFKKYKEKNKEKLTEYARNYYKNNKIKILEDKKNIIKKILV
jgi:NAD+--asparagine ADP-ribosyltransferase